MSKTLKSYSAYVTRGPQYKIGDKIFQKRVGAVVVVPQGKNLYVGWSLCNCRQGDRFNAEQAMSLAEGRARLQHTNSLSIPKDQSPTTREMIRKGVPQSCLSVMSQLIAQALQDNKDISNVVVFNTKTEKVESVPQPMW